MIKLGITGGIGSGKSYLSRLLKEQDIPVYDTDQEAKRLMITDGIIRKSLINLLGTSVYQNDTLNKTLLSEYIFSNEDHTRRINAIVHPRVKSDFLQWASNLSQKGKKIIALESAILFESGFDNAVDYTITVSAPINLRIQRTIQRDQTTEVQVRRRIQAQMTEEERNKRANFIIINDEKHDLYSQMSNILSLIKRKHAE
ncbi:MAG TPA: dephospho-CoA kinase [Candidatus Phocaeicola gallistercoris]|nr:dephospho-CoA kinase [Candidatus Phocaeicola gallistercoris]